LDSITTSATATYNLQLNGGAYYPTSANHLLVSLNGVMQAPQDSFTVSGSTITFASALTSSDSIDFIMALGDVLDIGVPSDGTVNTSQLANSAVTDAKMASTLDLSSKTVTYGLTDSDMPGKFSDLRCIATTSTATSMASLSTYYKGVWNGELIDNYNEFDTSNSKFTASETGTYEITIHTTCRLNNTGDVYQNKLYKNGSALFPTEPYEQGVSDGNAQCNLMYTAVLELNANDYIEQYVAWTGSGSSRSANHYNSLCFWIVRKVA
jgi:hypothetical protein